MRPYPRSDDSNRKVYGVPRIYAEPADADVHVGRERVARLMRQAGMVGRHRRERPVSITSQTPPADVAPDLVDRNFTATAPNQLWVADVTYVPMVQGGSVCVEVYVIPVELSS